MSGNCLTPHRPRSTREFGLRVSNLGLQTSQTPSISVPQKRQLSASIFGPVTVKRSRSLSSLCYWDRMCKRHPLGRVSFQVTLLQVAVVQRVATGRLLGLIASNSVCHYPLPAAPRVGCSLLTQVQPRARGLSFGRAETQAQLPGCGRHAISRSWRRCCAPSPLSWRAAPRGGLEPQPAKKTPLTEARKFLAPYRVRVETRKSGSGKRVLKGQSVWSHVQFYQSLPGPK
jgi:hypothetical protein